MLGVIFVEKLEKRTKLERDCSCDGQATALLRRLDRKNCLLGDLTDRSS